MFRGLLLTDLQISARLKENEQKWLVKIIEKYTGRH